MLIVKFIFLFLILLCSGYIGILISRKYLNRESELKEMKSALNTFKTKIKFTYEPIPEVFKEISHKSKENISNIFYSASEEMKHLSAGNAWEFALDKTQTNFNSEDITTLKSLSSLLGKVDIEGQLNQIELVNKFLDEQIEKASEEKNKYVKMYKTLGVVIGITIIIILV